MQPHAPKSIQGGTYVPEFYTGREISLKQALDYANTVVLGEVSATGTRDVGATGQSYYSDASLHVERWLRTTLPPEERPARLSFDCTVQTLPADKAERVPSVGEHLLILGRMERAGLMSAIKILPLSGEEAREVEKELR
jgi:hypothetical protein